MNQYSHNLFYIAPFYHLAFPNLDHLIATDLDIEFRYLYKELLALLVALHFTSVGRC